LSATLLRASTDRSLSTLDERNGARPGPGAPATSLPVDFAESGGTEPGEGLAEQVESPIDRDAVYAELQPLVRRLIRQYGEDAEMRQDLAGEIYCRFCDLLEAYDPARGIPLRPYLIRTLTASVYTYARSHWRNKKRERGLEIGQDGPEPAGSVECPTPAWDRRLMTGQVLEALPQVMANLPLRQRQVVIWRYYEGRSYEQIAGDLNIRQATARSLLRHGITNLRRQLVQAGVEWE
jgi:RNA polymerase sigma factor (sigma-70 family)